MYYDLCRISTRFRDNQIHSKSAKCTWAIPHFWESEKRWEKRGRQRLVYFVGRWGTLCYVVSSWISLPPQVLRVSKLEKAWDSKDFIYCGRLGKRALKSVHGLFPLLRIQPMKHPHPLTRPDRSRRPSSPWWCAVYYHTQTNIHNNPAHKNSTAMGASSYPMWGAKELNSNVVCIMISDNILQRKMERVHHKNSPRQHRLVLGQYFEQYDVWRLIFNGIHSAIE